MIKVSKFLKTWLPEISLFAIAILLLTWNLSNRALWNTEGEWACVIREMIQSGDFLHPTINGDAFLRYPIASYWTMLPFSFITADVNELSLRIPSVIAGLISILCSYLLGKNFSSRKAALISGWIAMSSFGLIFWSRTATSVSLNTALIMIIITWYWYRKDNFSFLNSFVFILLCIAGLLTVGIPTLVAPLILLPDVISEGRWKKLLSKSFAASVFSAAILSAVILMFMAHNKTLHQTYITIKSTMPTFGMPFQQVPWYKYLEYIPKIIAPWSFMFLASVLGFAIHFKQQKREVKWMLNACIIAVVFFAASGHTRKYYLMPMTPICAVTTGLFFTSHFTSKTLNRRLQFFASEIQSFMASILISVAIVIPLAYNAPSVKNLVTYFTKIIPETGLITTTFIFGIISIFIASHTLKSQHIEHPLLKKVYFNLGVYTALIFLIYGTLTPMMEIYRQKNKFVETIKQFTDDLPGHRVLLYPKRSENLLFYLDRDLDEPVTVATSDSVLTDFIQSKDKGVIITRRKYLNELRNIYPQIGITPDFDTANEQLKNKRDFVGWKINY